MKKKRGNYFPLCHEFIYCINGVGIENVLPKCCKEENLSASLNLSRKITIFFQKDERRKTLMLLELFLERFLTNDV